MGRRQERVKVQAGSIYYIDRSGNQISLESLNEALEKEADCGCGLDCCNDKLVLPDVTTGNAVDITVDNGVLLVDGSDVVQAAQDAAEVDDPFPADGTEVETDMTYDGNTVYRQRITHQETSEPGEGTDFNFAHGITGIQEMVPIIFGKQTTDVSGTLTTDYVSYNGGISADGTNVYVKEFHSTGGALGTGDTVDFEIYLHYTKS